MILIVDDNKENLFSLRTLLQLYDYKVDTAASGEEALRKLLKNEYAVIILDVQMPDMDGYEVAEAVTGLNRTKDIPIIFLSAVNIDKRFITKGYESGAVDYVTKPFDPDLLLMKIKTFYRLSQQKQELKRIEEELREEVEVRKKAQKELEGMNLALEEKVGQRTRDLQQANHDLENRNMELGQFASVASHDLQEPLRKIITFGNRLQENYLLDAHGGRREMTKILSSALRMRNLIDDLLNYSKLSGNLPFINVDLRTIVNEVLNDLEIEIAEKKAIIEIGNLSEIEAVPGQMRQVLQNLIANAIKFSSKGQAPVIKIKSEKIAEKKIESPVMEGGKFCRLTVEDNGIGIDELYNEKIFVIFQRLHGNAEYEGTGIGLAIVKKIVEKHDGIVGVVSKEGQGAKFIVVLPTEHPNTQIKNSKTWTRSSGTSS